MDFHAFHGKVSFSRMMPNFTENVTAVKSRIRLVPTNVSLRQQYTQHEKQQDQAPSQD